MSSSLFHRRNAIALLFLVLLSFNVLFGLAKDASDVNDQHHVASDRNKPDRGFRMSGTQILAKVMNFVSSVGGDSAQKAINELQSNLAQSTAILKSLGTTSTVDSINFLLRNVLLSFCDAARHAATKNDVSMTIQGSDLAELLGVMRLSVMQKCAEKKDFAAIALQHLEIVLPHVMQALAGLYGNVVASTGLGLSFGMLSQAGTMLMLLDRSQYVTTATFAHFARFPDEIKGQLERALDSFLAAYNIDDAKIDMALNMAKMYTSTLVNNHNVEKEEL